MRAKPTGPRLDPAGGLIYPQRSTPKPVSPKGRSLGRSYFHLHLVSDSTGETLITVARAVVAQYEDVSAIEHVYPLVRSMPQLARVMAEITAAPAILLYTLVWPAPSRKLRAGCPA